MMTREKTKAVKLKSGELFLLDFLLEQAIEGYWDMADILEPAGWTRQNLEIFQHYLSVKNRS